MLKQLVMLRTWANFHIFEGDPAPDNGYINLDDNKPGLELTITDKFKSDSKIIE